MTSDKKPDRWVLVDRNGVPFAERGPSAMIYVFTEKADADISVFEMRDSGERSARPVRLEFLDKPKVVVAEALKRHGIDPKKVEGEVANDRRFSQEDNDE